MSKEYKANRYVHEKMFPHIANMQRANEKIACFTEDDLKEAYIQGWNDSVLDIKRSANIKIAEADEYARQKINEAYGEVVLLVRKLLKKQKCLLITTSCTSKSKKMFYIKRNCNSYEYTLWQSRSRKTNRHTTD